jgi:hypothetical protein
MALVGQTKGAISNAEMALFLAASPSLASTYQGAVRQAEFLQRISNLQMKMAEDWARDADSVLAGIDATDSETKLRAARNWEINWRKSNPFLREDEIRELQDAAKKETPESRGYREALRPNTLSDDGLVTDFS